jgi:hypothetical protein
MKLSIRTTAVLQLAGAFSHLILPTMPFMVESRLFLHAAVGFAQAAAAMWAHYSNPDGTPAEQPYQPRPRRRRKDDTR